MKIILIFFSLFVVWQLAIRLLRKRFHFPAPAFIGRLLDSNFRRMVQPPQVIIERSGIKEGMTVLEIGCGSGAYTTFVARKVGTAGKVYALDIQQDMLKQLERKMHRRENTSIGNIFLVNKSAYELPFNNDSVDLAYMITVLQEIPDRAKALEEARRVLKPGGILAITEFLPDPDYPLRSTTIKEGESAGFVIDAALGNFWTYTVRFKK